MAEINSLLILISITALIGLQGILGQEFHFDDGIKYNETCGPNALTNWSSHGSVTLTKGDLEGFEPKVIIRAFTDLCTVDLTVCPPEHLPTSPHACYCKARSGDSYDVHVGSQTAAALSGMDLQAVVPGHGPLRNIFGAATIGTIPNVTENASHVRASYAIDNGVSRDLSDVQTVSVCPDTRFHLEICVHNGQPDAHLNIGVGLTRVGSIGRCVALSHKLTSGGTETVNFQYKEPHGCTKSNKIFLKEHHQACSNHTPSIVPPTDVQTTTAATITTTSSERPTTTITAHKKEQVCPYKPVTVETTLASGATALIDDVSFDSTWTIFQRRQSGTVNFYRPWKDYVNGFGDTSDSFWLGLESIHKLCNQKSKCQLLVNLMYPGPTQSVSRRPDGCYYALYDDFWLGDATQKYAITIGKFSGTAGNSMVTDNAALNINKRPFYTYDRPDIHKCPNLDHGAWWYSDCSVSKLNNGWVNSGGRTAVIWYTLTGYNSVTFSEMKVRNKSTS